MAEKLFCGLASLDQREPLPGLGHSSTRTLLWRVPKARWQDSRRAVQKREGEVALAIALPPRTDVPHQANTRDPILAVH